MRKLKGTIVSDTMNRTRVIEITRMKKHRRYERYFTVTKRLKADDPKNEYKTGEVVVIEETRPLSKEKRWRVVGLAQKSEPKAK